MIKYAELDSNSNVINIIMATEASILGIPGMFVKSDIDSNPSRRDAAIGGTYNKIKDKFVHPKPYPSWILNEDTLVWESPIGNQPDDGKKYMWNEESQEWQELFLIEIDLQN